MKKILKLIILLFITFFIITFLFNNFSLAKSALDYANDAANGEGDFAGDDTGVSEKAKSVMGGIVNTARIITMGIAATIIFVLAAKYMMSAPEGRADIRKTAVTYFIGAFVMFSASGILGIIASVAL